MYLQSPVVPTPSWSSEEMHSSVSHNPGRVLHMVRKASESFMCFACQWHEGFLLHPFSSLAPRAKPDKFCQELGMGEAWRQMTGRVKGVALQCETPAFAVERRKEPEDAWSRSKYLTQPLSEAYIEVSKQSRPVAKSSQFPQWKVSIKAARNGYKSLQVGLGESGE